MVPGSEEFSAEQSFLQPPEEQTDIVHVIRGVIKAETGAIEHYTRIVEETEGVDPVTQDMVIDDPPRRAGPPPPLRGLPARVRGRRDRRAMTRLLAIVTDTVEGPESIEALTGREEPIGSRSGSSCRRSRRRQFRHALGDVDEPAREAGERLETSLEELRRSGISASGAVGDPDPVLAAKDALREEPADEVVIFERAPSRRAGSRTASSSAPREEIAPPLRMVLVSPGDNGGPHIVAVEDADAGPPPARPRGRSSRYRRTCRASRAATSPGWSSAWSARSSRSCSPPPAPVRRPPRAPPRS